MNQHEWDTKIQPVLEDVFECITHIIEGTEDTDLFRKCGPIGLYTTIYKMTTSCSFDFVHLDFLYNQEVNAVVSFCKRFLIHDLEEMNRHIQGFKLLIRWFYCFFHHLNRTRHKIYPNVREVEDDMDRAVRDAYFREQQDTISGLIRDHWYKVRSQNYSIDHTLLEILTHITAFDPLYHENILSFYYSDIVYYAQRKSTYWLSDGNSILSYMEKANWFFFQEKKMFFFYFPQHKDKLSFLYALLKNILIHPYRDRFLHDDQYGWKAVIRSQDLSTMHTFYQFYYWVDDHSSWWDVHQEYLEETIRSFPTNERIGNFDRFRKEQCNIMETIFTQETTRTRFVEIMDKVFQKKLSQDTPMVVQLVKTIHHYIIKKSSTPIITDLCALVKYCSDKDFFYEHYHACMKSRLLSWRFHVPHEKMVMCCLQETFGVSFVLNLHLMLEEVHKNCLSHGAYNMFRLSDVVWGSTKPLQYRPPVHVEKILQKLQDQWREQTIPTIRLKPQWLQGSVVLSMNSSEFVMSPIQAIVILALGTPVSRQGLVEILGIPDDDTHNLEGVLESLVRPGLLTHEKGLWQRKSTPHPSKRVMVPPVKNIQKKNINSSVELSPLVADAFIVRVLKRETTMSFARLHTLLSEHYPMIQISEARKRVDSLVEREFLSRQENNVLCYVP